MRGSSGGCCTCLQCGQAGSVVGLPQLGVGMKWRDIGVNVRAGEGRFCVGLDKISMKPREGVGRVGGLAL